MWSSISFAVFFFFLCCCFIFQSIFYTETLTSKFAWLQPLGAKHGSILKVQQFFVESDTNRSASHIMPLNNHNSPQTKHWKSGLQSVAPVTSRTEVGTTTTSHLSGLAHIKLSKARRQNSQELYSHPWHTISLSLWLSALWTHGFESFLSTTSTTFTRIQNFWRIYLSFLLLF